MGRIKTIPKPSWFKGLWYLQPSLKMVEKALCSLYSYIQKAAYYSSACYMAIHTNFLVLKVMLIVPLLNLSDQPSFLAGLVHNSLTI